ncbi:hypothetical protein [Natrinema salaciae]|uniref:Uncharacterized protein n=1 Tax=Natrinema salaciae TaxID=1186196 RepID=A0A1H9STJ9_9EURY|nr:hypothetical protein [Natrinema salaciae]SER88197.1 hypothetical protein SAMN04489841_4811 [Natrinema salaciae]
MTLLQVFSIIPNVESPFALIVIFLLSVFILQHIFIYLSFPEYSREAISDNDITRIHKESNDRKTETLSLLALVLTIAVFALSNNGAENITPEIVLPISLSILFLLTSLISGFFYSKYNIAAEVQSSGNTYAFGTLLLSLLFLFNTRIQSSSIITQSERILASVLIYSSLAIIAVFGLISFKEIIYHQCLWYLYSLEEDEKDNYISKSIKHGGNDITFYSMFSLHEIRIFFGIREFLRTATEEELDEYD